MKIKHFFTGLSVLLAVSSLTHAQPAPYPVSRVSLVTHSSPGGGTDVFLRDFSKQLSGVMKTSFSVENIRGGSGATAVAAVAKGAPDGSIFYGTTPTYIQTTLLSKPPVGYDGLDPMLIVFLDPELIYTRADSPHKTLADVIACQIQSRQIPLGRVQSGLAGAHRYGASFARSGRESSDRQS